MRRPHGFEPTRRALELGPQGEALIALAGEALSPDARFDPVKSTRTFRMAAPEFVTALIGANLLHQLKTAAPGVTFAIGHFDEDEAFRWLRRGEMDFAVGRFGAARPGYQVEPLFGDAYCVVARISHPTIRGAIDVDQWQTSGQILAWNPSETAGDGPKMEEAPHIRVLAMVPHWLTVLSLVADTDGIGTVPRRLAERHAERFRLQVLDLPFPPNPINVSVMRRTGAADAGADWFLDQVRAALDA